MSDYGVSFLSVFFFSKIIAHHKKQSAMTVQSIKNNMKSINDSLLASNQLAITEHTTFKMLLQNSINIYHWS